MKYRRAVFKKTRGKIKCDQKNQFLEPTLNVLELMSVIHYSKA